MGHAMREFFRGWRRKTGSMLVLFACALMVIWFRSYAISDDLGYFFQNDYRLTIGGGQLSWSRTIHSFPFPDPDPETFWQTVWWKTAKYIPADAVTDHKYLSKYELSGIEVSVSDQRLVYPVADSVRVSLWRVPLMLLIVPVTLLSAYLILWMRRRAKPSDQPTNPNINSN
ncbi:MAG: hypothetical protein JWP89_1573 [Schlesneria sp.]|nr:hypothetical protein [Schlesneria sp.]